MIHSTLKMLLMFYMLFDPRGQGTPEIHGVHTHSINNKLIFAEIGFQKLLIGRDSVLTEYEPMAIRVDPANMGKPCSPKSCTKLDLSQVSIVWWRIANTIMEA